MVAVWAEPVCPAVIHFAALDGDVTSNGGWCGEGKVQTAAAADSVAGDGMVMPAGACAP